MRCRGEMLTRRGPLFARRALTALACAALLTASLSGCRVSDDLVGVVYTQDADIIDTSVPQKNYVLSEQAQRSLSLAQATALMGEVAYEQVEQTVPVFGVPTNTQVPIEQVLYDENSASSRTAPYFPSDPSEFEDDADQDEDAGEGGDGEDDGEGDGKGDAGADENDEARNGASSNEDQSKAYNSSGSLLKPLDGVSSIATVGEWANLVLMLGGPGSLAGADSAFLEDEGAQRVFSKEEWEFDQIPVFWTVDPDSGVYVLDYELLKEVHPDLVWLPDGMEIMTEQQRDELLEMGIYVEPAPKMKSTQALSEMATWLGATLGISEKTGRDAADAARTYVETYLGSDIDELIAENGGLTTYNNVDYSGSGKDISSTSNWCVLVTDYDAEATYNAGIWEDTGVAIATSGYGWSPVNYYLSVGGVNNNAAQFPNASMAQKRSGDYYVWQFNMSMLDPASVKGTKATDDFGETSYGWAQCLVGAPASVNRDSQFEVTLGCENFRYLICATQQISDALERQRDEGTASQSGLYAAYNYSEGERLQESGVGPRTSDGVLIRSYIAGFNNGIKSLGQLAIEQGLKPYEIITCGNGLYCNWVEGSVESFLMAYWADDLYDGEGTDFANLREEAAKFYAEFYGYELSDEDLDEICAGREN